MLTICTKCNKPLEKPRVRNIKAKCLKCQAKLGKKNSKKYRKSLLIKNKGV